MKKINIQCNFIKMFLVVCAMVMMFSADVQAAKLNKKSITLEVGNTYTLKMKDSKKKVTWKTKNKKVAKLSSKKRSSVKIKAVKVGKTTVSGKIGKKTYKCKVTVVKVKDDKSAASAEEQTTEETTTATEDTMESTTETTTEQKVEKYNVWIVTKWGSILSEPVYVNKRSQIECTACGHKTENFDEAVAHQDNHILNGEKNGYRVNAIWDDVYWVDTEYPEEGYWMEVDVGTYPEGLKWRAAEDAVQRLMKDTTTGQVFTPTEGYYYIDKSGE